MNFAGRMGLDSASKLDDLTRWNSKIMVHSAGGLVAGNFIFFLFPILSGQFKPGLNGQVPVQST